MIVRKKGGAHGIRNDPYAPRLFVCFRPGLFRVAGRSVMLPEQFPDCRFRIEDVAFAQCDKGYLPRVAQRLQGTGRDMEQIAHLAAREVTFRPGSRTVAFLNSLQHLGCSVE